MTTYNTGNPVPSGDARDRFDNSQTFDQVINSPLVSAPTRLGAQVKTLAGYGVEFEESQDSREQAFQLFLDSTGWSSLGTYAAGISIVSHTQTVDYLGQPYSLKPSVPASISAPYITTGNWAVEGTNFKLVGDNSLRQDLASALGVVNIGGAITVVQSIDAVRALSTTSASKFALVAGVGFQSFYKLNLVDTVPADNGGSVLIPASGSGFWQLLKNSSTSVLQYGAKCDGVTDDTAAVQACAANETSWHFPESGICYLANKVSITLNNSRVTSLGAEIKQRDFTGLSARAIEVSATGVILDKLRFDANGTAGSGQVTIFVTGAFCTVSNCTFRGNVGHYIFFYHSLGSRAFNNYCDGEGAGLREVTTAIVFENCFRFEAFRNRMNNIPVGWGIQARQGCLNGQINGNETYQKQWNDTKTATQGQDFFEFDLGGFAFLPLVQIKTTSSPYFLPKSKGYIRTRNATDPNKWTIQFTDGGRNAGEQIRLAGYSGSENIQMNASTDIVCNDNFVDGGGDSGIIALGQRISMTGNQVKNTAYAGIAIYGGVHDVTVNGGVISDCSQLDDGLSSPDDPNQPSAFCTGILIAGARATVNGVSFVNASGTMLSAISAGNAEDTLNYTSGPNASIKINGCVYSGDYAYGPVHIPNDGSGVRSTSVQVSDAPKVEYPQSPDFDAAGWTELPGSTPYLTYSSSGSGVSSRDAAVIVGGVASLKVTGTGSFADVNLAAGALLQKSVVEISIWAKRTDGASYFSAITRLAGLETETRVDLVGTDWRRYSLFIPISGNLEAYLRLRMGTLLGTANFQFPTFKVCRL